MSRYHGAVSAEQFFCNPQDQDDLICNGFRIRFLAALHRLEPDVGMFTALRQEVLPSYLEVHRDYQLSHPMKHSGIYLGLEPSRWLATGVSVEAYDLLKHKLSTWAERYNLNFPWFLGVAVWTLRAWADDPPARERVVPTGPYIGIAAYPGDWPTLRALFNYLAQELLTGAPSNLPMPVFTNPLPENPALSTLRDGLRHYGADLIEARVGLSEMPPPHAFWDGPLILDKGQPGWLTDLIERNALIQAAALHKVIETLGWLAERFEELERGERSPWEAYSDWPPWELHSGYSDLADALESCDFATYAPWLEVNHYRELTLAAFAESEFLHLLTEAFETLTYTDHPEQIHTFLMERFSSQLDTYMKAKQKAWRAAGYITPSQIEDNIVFEWLVQWHVQELGWAEIVRRAGEHRPRSITTVRTQVEKAYRYTGLPRRKGKPGRPKTAVGNAQRK